LDLCLFCVRLSQRYGSLVKKEEETLALPLPADTSSSSSRIRTYFIAMIDGVDIDGELDKLAAQLHARRVYDDGVGLPTIYPGLQRAVDTRPAASYVQSLAAPVDISSAVHAPVSEGPSLLRQRWEALAGGGESADDAADRQAKRATPEPAPVATWDVRLGHAASNVFKAVAAAVCVAFFAALLLLWQSPPFVCDGGSADGVFASAVAPAKVVACSAVAGLVAGALCGVSAFCRPSPRDSQT
jgi:hypothetical protein